MITSNQKILSDSSKYLQPVKWLVFSNALVFNKNILLVQSSSIISIMALVVCFPSASVISSIDIQFFQKTHVILCFSSFLRNNHQHGIFQMLIQYEHLFEYITARILRHSVFCNLFRSILADTITLYKSILKGNFFDVRFINCYWQLFFFLIQLTFYSPTIFLCFNVLC